MSVTPDERGPGHALYRYDDHPSVDFGRLEGGNSKWASHMEFVHANGFIAKTKAKEVATDLLAMVEAATDTGAAAEAVSWSDVMKTYDPPEA